MPLYNLVESECGRVNPLVQLTSHILTDRAHREDGLNAREKKFTDTDTDELLQEFLGDKYGHAPQTFRMDALLQQMHEIEATANRHLHGKISLAVSDKPTNVPIQKSVWMEDVLNSVGPLDKTELNNVMKGGGPQFDYRLDLSKHLDANRQRIDVQENWLQHRPFFDQCLQQERERVLNFMTSPQHYFPEFLHQDEDRELLNVVSEESENAWFEKNYKLENSMDTSDKSESSGITCECSEPEKESEEEFFNELWDKLSASWQNVMNPDEQTWGSDISDLYDPFREYVFEDKNPMVEQANALEEGKKRLEEGDIVGAVLCFEAAVQSDPKNSEAWQLLGITQAENEQDPSAIAALKTCLSLDPGNLKSLMALAVSYTNESYPYHAIHYLKEWLRKNPVYSDLVPKSDTSHPPHTSFSSYLSGNNLQDVQNLFMVAARLHPQENIDADVQCGLGVLFNLSQEYGKAVDCFKTALQIRPSDSRIWNRLGATLANGDKSVDAVNAYHRALVLSPGFVRARYNLGVTCLNLCAYREAAEHFLTALNQQARVKGNSRSTMSNSIWTTLRLVMSIQNRQDLCKVIDDRDLSKLNDELDIGK